MYAIVYAQDTDELAIEFSAPTQYFMKQLYMGGSVNAPILPESEAMERLKGATLMQRVNNPLFPPQFIVGKVETVAEELKTVAKALGAEEIILQIMTADHTKLLKSLELLAKHLIEE